MIRILVSYTICAFMRMELMIGYARTEFIEKCSILEHLHHFIDQVVDDHRSRSFPRSLSVSGVRPGALK